MHRLVWIIFICILELVTAGSKVHYQLKRKIKAKQKLIFGGLPVPVTQFPHIAQITYRDAHYCMGSILNEYTIVTAAHCVSMFYDEKEDATIEEMDVYVGSSKSMKGAKYEICDLTMHEKYTDAKYPYDIALLFLKYDIELNDKTVTTIEIAPDTSWRDPSTKMAVAGFGDTDNQGHASDFLKATWMKYVPPEVCNRSQTLVDNPDIPDNSMFCMVADNWSSDCFGDSGSGIVWKKFVTGVVVSGLYDQCGSSLMPSVYTNLVYFRPWIEKHIEEYENSSKECRNDKRRKRKRAKKLTVMMQLKTKSCLLA